MPNADTLPPIANPEKHEAVDALLLHINGGELKKIVRGLCEDVIKTPGFHASRSHICKKYLEADPKLTTNTSFVRDKWRQLKELVDELYEKGTLTTPVRVQLFTAENVGNKPNHSVRFIRVSLSSRSFGIAGMVGQLWQEMIHSVEVNELVFVYKTHSFAANKEFDGDAELWTGSGEIEAVQLLTEMLVKTQPRLALGTRRWCDMPQRNLEKKYRCLVLLGSAVNDKNMDTLKIRDGWRELQMFHFEQPKGKRCRIRKGKRNAHASEADKTIEYLSGTNPNIDFALVSFFRDSDNGQSIIALQGITTVATLGAARFMCSDRGVRELRRQLCEKSTPGTGLPSFEAILSMPVDNGLPGDAHIEALEPYLG